MGRSMQNPHLYHVAHFTDKDGKKHMLTVEFDAEGKPGGNSKERYGRITLFNYSAGNSAESTYNVTINGKVIAEPWFPATPLGPPITTQKIPAGQYFVMGDNRTDSCDSRTWGTVPRSNIIGHVVFRIWPISRIGVP